MNNARSVTKLLVRAHILLAPERPAKQADMVLVYSYFNC